MRGLDFGRDFEFKASGHRAEEFGFWISGYRVKELLLRILGEAALGFGFRVGEPQAVSQPQN